MEAVNHNYYSAECDIHLTKDNQWVVIHNSTVNARFCQMGKVRDYTLEELNGFEYEDYRRHQGVRHPRVAVALTEDNDLLFVVVDGRFSGKAEGMSAKELTNFLVKHFNPQWAINMDGGGSSTMYINGYGDPVTNVLNYPCDNKKWDHYGQRARPTFFLVQYDE